MFLGVHFFYQRIIKINTSNVSVLSIVWNTTGRNLFEWFPRRICWLLCVAAHMHVVVWVSEYTVRLYKQLERDNRMVTSTIHMRLSLQWMLITIFNDVDAYCLAVCIFFYCFVWIRYSQSNTPLVCMCWWYFQMFAPFVDLAVFLRMKASTSKYEIAFKTECGTHTHIDVEFKKYRKKDREAKTNEWA